MTRGTGLTRKNAPSQKAVAGCRKVSSTTSSSSVSPPIRLQKLLRSCSGRSKVPNFGYLLDICCSLRSETRVLFWYRAQVTCLLHTVRIRCGFLQHGSTNTAGSRGAACHTSYGCPHEGKSRGSSRCRGRTAACSSHARQRGRLAAAAARKRADAPRSCCS